jgi:hypothetical protein
MQNTNKISLNYSKPQPRLLLPNAGANFTTMKIIKLANHTAINCDHIKEVKITIAGTDHYIDFVIEKSYIKSVYAGSKHDAYNLFNKIVNFATSDKTLFEI